MAAGSPESSVFWAHIEKRRDFLVFSCLLLAGFSIYVSPRWHYFHSDEVVWFHALHAQNDAPLLWREFWTGSPWDYRPLKSLYLVTLHKILGDWSEAFHATNVLLHAGSAILVYLLALRLRLETVPAWLAAFLVVVHPAPYQAVRWVIDCASLLQAFFCLLALLPLLIYIDGRRPLYLCLALLAAIASMYSKESGIVALVLLPLADLLLAYSRNWKRLKAYWPVPMMLLIFLSLSLRDIPGWRQHLDQYYLGTHVLANLAYSLGFLLIPPDHFDDLFFLTSVAGILLVLAAIYSPRNRKIGIFLATWLVLAALPTALFIHQGSYNTTGRHSLAWLAPFALVLAFLFQRLVQIGDARLKGLLSLGALGVATLALTVMGVRTSKIAATPYETHPGPILYNYVVLSLMSYEGADRYLAAELGCPASAQMDEANLWGQKIENGQTNGIWVLQGELVSGLSLAILGQREKAAIKFKKALQVLESHASVQFVRGADVPLSRALQLTQLWLQIPPVLVCEGHKSQSRNLTFE